MVALIHKANRFARNRMVRSSLHDIEQRYNQQMEKTTLMEGELITKTQLEEENQRLRDEIRGKFCVATLRTSSGLSSHNFSFPLYLQSSTKR